MKENELREHAVCSICGKKIGHTGLPLFWTVEIKRHGLLLDAIRRQDGLTALMGGHAGLSAIMGPNDEMTECILTATLTLCEKCAVVADLPVAELAERRDAE
jgi:hypothetical protein